MSRKVTIQDIARETGLSKSTISRVITNNGYVNENTRAIVLEAINELNYKPQKKHKINDVSDLVMIVSGLLMSPVQITIIENIIKELHNYGLKSMISYNDFETYELEEYLLYAKERNFAGVILLGVLETPSLIATLKSIEYPIVLLNQELKGIDVNVVSMDDYRGGYTATKYLIDRGHKRVGLLMGYSNATAASKRENGYCDAMKDAGLKTLQSDVYYGDFTEMSGVKFAQRLFDTQSSITGIVSCNDLMTVGLIGELTRLGFKIPEDCSVIGFDDSLVTSISRTKITTVNYHFDKIGITAAQMIKDNLEKPFLPKRKISFSPELIERESVKSYF